MRKRTLPAFLSLLLPSLVAAGSAHATLYEVGPSAPYANIGDVPIESLKAGDTVLIHARSTPYREKFGIVGKGTAASPITVRGVRDANGVRPRLIGENATTRLALDYPSDTRGVINIYEASYVVIEGLDISRARGSFKDDNGNSATFQDNASTIYLQSGSHITIRDCIMSGSGNGFFSTSSSSDVVLEGNYLHGNGNVGSIYEHNNYTDSNGIVFQYNRFGPLCEGCSGGNLKDRSAGTVIRYNWIEGGNRALDLVEGGWSGLASYRTTMVYGNVLIELNDSGNPQVVHYGGDSGDESSYRKGTLHFVHNTVVSFRAGRTRLMRLSSNDETAEIRNNIIYATAGGSQMSISDGEGKFIMAGNWISSGWTSGLSGGTLTQPAPQLTGSNPGFVDFAAADYHLTTTSPARDAAGALQTGAPTVDRQYVVHQDIETRVVDGTPDIGAFEYNGGTILRDAGVSPPPADAARTPDASPPLPDAARPDAARTPDTAQADSATASKRDASTISRDTRTSDTPARVEGGQTPREAQTQDGPRAVDSTTVGKDANISDAWAQERPSSLDALRSGRDSPPPIEVGVDAAISTASPGACAMSPDQGGRSVSKSWLALGALMLVRRRRFRRRE